MSADLRGDVKGRARSALLPLTFVALFAWLDWVLHRNLVFILVVGGVVVVAILYRGEIAQRSGLGEFMRGLSPVNQALIRAAPALLYFLLRARGTAGLGAILVVLVALGVVIGMVKYGAKIDQRLAPFYRVRDRALSLRVRTVMAVIFPVVVGFGIIHGSLADLPALFGGATSSPQTPVGLEAQYFLGAVLCAGVTILLLRKGAPR
jgi:hypothetical protein